MAGVGYVVYMVCAYSKGVTFIGSKLVVVQYTYGEIFTVMPNRILCSPTDTSPVRSIGALCEKKRRQDEAACMIARLQPHRTYLEWIGPCNNQCRQPPQNLSELRQAMLNKWAEIPVERLQRLVAGMSRRLVAIIAAKGGNTLYWPCIHSTTPTGSFMKKKIKFVWPDLSQLPSNDI